MELYRSKFKHTEYDEKLSLLANYWTDAIMRDKDFQDEILAWVDLAKKYKPKNLLADTTLFNYTISTEMQTWTNEVVFPQLVAAGAKKFAVIMHPDIITQLSLEQTMEESEAAALQNQFFGSVAEAIEWFKQ